MDLQSSLAAAVASETFARPPAGHGDPASDAIRADLVRSLPTLSSDPLTMLVATMRTGIVLVAADATVAYVNEAAREALNARIGLALHGDRVVATGLDGRRRLTQALAQACHAPFVDGAVLLRSGPERAAGRPVRVLSMRRIAGIGRDAREGMAVLCIGQARRPVPEPSMLAQLFGLTATESALMAAIAGGERLHQCADRRGVSLATVRAQLRNVFVKTGAGTQAELTMIAWSIPGLWVH